VQGLGVGCRAPGSCRFAAGRNPPVGVYVLCFHGLGFGAWGSWFVIWVSGFEV